MSFVVVLVATIFQIFLFLSKSEAEDTYWRTEYPEKPNFIILLADDLGYGDLSCYGHPTQEWGPIDQMAKEGLRFTQFYSADSLCTPSRAGLLTGRLPIRLGIFNRPKRCLHPQDRGGLPRNEKIIPEYLKPLGYRSGMVGKWHLGINAFNKSDGTHLPTHRFDFVGTNLPYTINFDCDDTGVFAKSGPNPDKCFVYFGDRIVQQPIRFERLTARLVVDFKGFVDSNLNQPFFFYFSLPQVHVNLYASQRFNGSSIRGMFGDNLNEMAWAVGEVLSYLKQKNLDQKTYVLFLSDHGPHEALCQLGGVSGEFSGRDPQERDPLDTQDLQVAEMLQEVGEKTRIHRDTMVPGEIQLGNWDNGVIPCCDPPKCQCDLLGDSIPGSREEL